MRVEGRFEAILECARFPEKQLIMFAYFYRLVQVINLSSLVSCYKCSGPSIIFNVIKVRYI
jgi:hypothetical protein